MTLPVAPPRTGLSDIADAVTPRLAAFAERRREAVEPVGPAFVDAAAILERFVLGSGKRIRPAFAWAGWLAGGGDFEGDAARGALEACSALEFVQACALIHDDIIDASLTRRGRPTVHREFADIHARRAWSGSADRFGEGAAILLGDLALAWADDMFYGAQLAAEGFSPARYRAAADAWSAMRTEVLGGQLLDIVSEAAQHQSADSLENVAERVIRYKTAGYTVERPLHIGAALAGASRDTVDALRAIGVDLGMAFQLRDDLLGAFGDPATTGKPSGDDLRSGKLTPMLASALTADPSDAAVAELQELIGTELDEVGVERARAALRATGAPDRMQTRIEELTERATREIARAPMSDGARPLLTALAAILVNRTA